MKKNLFVILMCLMLTGCATKSQTKEAAAKVVDSYNQEKINYDEAVSELNNYLADTSNEEVTQYINEQLTLLNELNESKINYERANEEYENSDYEEAMKYYDMVIEKDSNYETAQSQTEESQKKYIEVADQQAQIYIDDEKYLKAVEVYESAQKVYDDGSIDKKIADIEESYKASLEATALEYENSKEWGSAISTYETLYDYFKDEAYQVNITDVTNKCINAAIEEAEQYLSEGNITDAKIIIQTAESYVGDDAELQDEITRIESFEPVNLMNLDTFYTEENGARAYNWEVSDTDNIGNRYESGIRVNTYTNTSVVVSYMINGEYDILSGKFVLHSESKDRIDEKYAIQLYVYGDDKLLYTSGVMRGGVLPEEVNVNISGVNELKIEIKSENHAGGKVGFVEPILQKEYTALD